MKTLEKQDLIKVAKELNEVLGLEPAINLKADEETLKNKLEEAFELIDPKEDEFTEFTQQVIDQFNTSGEILTEEVKEEVKEEVVFASKEAKRVFLFKEIKKATNMMPIPAVNHLKILVTTYEEFESLLPNLTGKFNVTTMIEDMYRALGSEDKIVEKPAKKEKFAKKEKKEKKVGIVATIVECVENADKKEGVSKEEVLTVLKQRFPERNETSMWSTVKLHIPYLITKERWEVKKLENGNFCKA